MDQIAKFVLKNGGSEGSEGPKGPKWIKLPNSGGGGGGGEGFKKVTAIDQIAKFVFNI